MFGVFGSFFDFFTKEIRLFVQKSRFFCSLCAQKGAECEINTRER